jgi:hypothetical protein
MAAAAASGDAATIGRILGAGGSVSRRNADGLAPLHVAAQAGQHAAVRCLVRMGADIEARDAAGHTPLHRAVLAGRVSIVAHLANLGADLDARVAEPAGATTALHLAAGARSDARPAPPSAPASRSASPLRFGYALSSAPHSRRASYDGAASASGSLGGINPDYAAPSMVEALLRAGARVDAVDARGETALHAAARAGDAGNVAALLGAGAAVNARSRAGETALAVLRAARRGGEKKAGVTLAAVSAGDDAAAEVERMLVERGGVESVASEAVGGRRSWGWRRRAVL